MLKTTVIDAGLLFMLWINCMLFFFFVDLKNYKAGFCSYWFDLRKCVAGSQLETKYGTIKIKLEFNANTTENLTVLLFEKHNTICTIDCNNKNVTFE
mgnify:CR=1 FL=1